MRTILFGFLIAGCGTASRPTTVSSSAVSAKPVTIDRLCKALEVCGHMPGLCDRQIGLNIWREDAGWMVKVVMGQSDETDKEALIDLEKGTAMACPRSSRRSAAGCSSMR